MRQNVIDHRQDGGSRRDIGDDALRIGLRRFGTAQLRGEPVCDLQHFRVDAADGLSHGMTVFAHTADYLTGVAAVAAVDVDKVMALLEGLVAELTCTVIVHAPQQDQFHGPSFADNLPIPILPARAGP